MKNETIEIIEKLDLLGTELYDLSNKGDSENKPIMREVYREIRNCMEKLSNMNYGSGKIINQ